MPDIQPERWDSRKARDVMPETGETVLCVMYDTPVITLDDPILNPPEEEA